MGKNFFILLLLFFSLKADTQLENETLDEFVPKTFVFDDTDRIFKYHLSCINERNKTEVYFQTLGNKLSYFTIHLYDNFTKIEKDDKYYKNYIERYSIYNSTIIFKNLTCNKDYYFVLNTYYEEDLRYSYFQITIYNNETKIFNLSPLSSTYYSLIPRKTGERFYYSFNEDTYAKIQHYGNLIIEVNGINKTLHMVDNSFNFTKDLKYNIYYNSNYRIDFQFKMDNTFYKYNIEDFPITIYEMFQSYYLEINISNYEVGEYILFQVNEGIDLEIKYQFKSDFNQNNFINYEKYEYFNFIPIKKTKNDSSLLIYISNNSPGKTYNIINLIKDKVMEINSEYDSTIKGPKFLYLEFYKLNNLKSFAIESNKSFSFYIQGIDEKIKVDKKGETNIYIYKQNNEKSQVFKRAFIYLNSTDYYHFVVNNFNFSIIESEYNSRGQDYIDLCQGEEPKTELYYYKSSDSFIELFTPVIGNFDSYFINEDKIKTLSDFDFSKNSEKKVLLPQNQKGYLKLVCKEPTLIRHYFIFGERAITISSGKRYFISTNLILHNIKFSDELKGETIPLRFSLFGAKNNTQVDLFLNHTNYTLGDKSLEFEIKLPSEDLQSYVIDFNISKDIKEEMLIEIVAGLTKKELEKYPVKNLDESLGNLNIEFEEGAIIKVPKEYGENYYNYSFIQYSFEFHKKFYIEISYDKIEFMALPNTHMFNPIYEYGQIVPLFNVNPYSYIPNNLSKSDEKFFYIFLYNYGADYLSIKKPKLFTDVKLKSINFFPQLKGEDEKYYYKIALPNEDYESLLIQSDKNFSSILSLSKDKTLYPLKSNQNNIYHIPIDKKDILNKNTYLNYYGAVYSEGYINFIPKNELGPYYIDENCYRFNPRIYQEYNENKIKFFSDSYSYFIKRPTIYYLIINEQDYNQLIFAALSQKRNFGENKMMLKVEDNGENERFEEIIEIDKKLNLKYSNVIVVPVDKESNLILMYYKKNTFFDYEHVTNIYIIVSIIVAAILVLFIIICLLHCYRKKKKEKNNIEEINMDEKIISDN